MNHKIEKILVAVDFSEPSLNAFHTATCLAEKHEAALYIVHADDKVLESIILNNLTVNGSARSPSSILAALINDTNTKYGGQPVLIEQKGNADEVILGTAVQYGCDIIVLGTNGASGYRQGYIGTTAYSVIRFAPCPVLLIPPQRKWSSFKRPLFPIRPVMTALRHYNLIRNFIEPDACMGILGLVSSQKESAMDDLGELIDEMKSKLAADHIGSEVYWDMKSAISDNVLMQAERNEADLIIVPPAIDVSIKQFYIGPNAHEIIRRGKVPMLVINRKNKNAAGRVMSNRQ